MGDKRQKEYEERMYLKALEEQESEDALFKYMMEQKELRRIIKVLEQHIAETSA